MTRQSRLDGRRPGRRARCHTTHRCWSLAASIADRTVLHPELGAAPWNCSKPPEAGPEFRAVHSDRMGVGLRQVSNLNQLISMVHLRCFRFLMKLPDAPDTTLYVRAQPAENDSKTAWHRSYPRSVRWIGPAAAVVPATLPSQAAGAPAVLVCGRRSRTKPSISLPGLRDAVLCARPGRTPATRVNGEARDYPDSMKSPRRTRGL